MKPVEQMVVMGFLALGMVLGAVTGAMLGNLIVRMVGGHP